MKYLLSFFAVLSFATAASGQTANKPLATTFKIRALDGKIFGKTNGIKGIDTIKVKLVRMLNR